MGPQNETTGRLGHGDLRGLFCPLRGQYVFCTPPLPRYGSSEVLRWMKGFIETAQKLVAAWHADPDNYSQLEEGLSALKAELEKFKD